jgi:hypothetical protein
MKYIAEVMFDNEREAKAFALANHASYRPAHTTPQGLEVAFELGFRTGEKCLVNLDYALEGFGRLMRGEIDAIIPKQQIATLS